MSPSRSHPRGYRPPRDRRELVVAVLGVLGVLMVTGLALWLLAPHSASTTVPSPTPVRLPTSITSGTTAPGHATTTVLAPATTVPGG